MWDVITYTFPNFNGCIVEVWEWISDFIPYFREHMLCYSCWNQGQSMLVKGPVLSKCNWWLIWFIQRINSPCRICYCLSPNVESHLAVCAAFGYCTSSCEYGLHMLRHMTICWPAAITPVKVHAHFIQYWLWKPEHSFTAESLVTSAQ